MKFILHAVVAAVF